MNYLAHAYLSFGYPELLVGNLISDFIKGKKQFDFPSGVQNGIVLHRAIDAFTDAHEATKTAKELFRPAYRLYSAAFVDVVYDHFLANDPLHFTNDSLMEFSVNTYHHLTEHSHHHPPYFEAFFPYMKSQNWLYHYHTTEGAIKSFGGVVRRAAYLNDSNPAAEVFQKYYSELQTCYNQFFPDLYEFVKKSPLVR
jgi:acyl carrier protein phosphodiesterase